jgi:hypothetical protein
VSNFRAALLVRGWTFSTSARDGSSWATSPRDGVAVISWLHCTSVEVR